VNLSIYMGRASALRWPRNGTSNEWVRCVGLDRRGAGLLDLDAAFFHRTVPDLDFFGEESVQCADGPLRDSNVIGREPITPTGASSATGLGVRG
jgi:hypothetical protein